MHLCHGLSIFYAIILVSDGNLVLTPRGDYYAQEEESFAATLCKNDGSQLLFTLEYVSVSDSSSLFAIASSIEGNSNVDLTVCQGTIYTYQYKTRYIDDPALVGQSVKLRVTTQSPSFSALSSGVIIFQALYSLTGSSTFATLGQDYSWSCDTSGEKPSGSPIMYICWYKGGYQSEEKVGCSYFNSGSCGTQDNIAPYIFDCTSTVFTMTIPGDHMDESQQKSLWRCVNFYRSMKNSPNYTSSFQELSLAIPVFNVTLLPLSIDSIENASTTIQCVPNSNANPQPTITWFKDNVDITNQALQDRKRITLTFTRSDNNKALRCTATGQSSSVNATANINVKFPPSSNPVITGYNGSALHEGDGTITVTCRQEGGNPVANMTFACLGNGGTVTPSSNFVTSSHALTIDRSLDKQICTCTTTHSIGNFERTVTKQFTVYYPPLKPSFKLNPPYPWKSGDNRQVTCMTSGGNPTVYNFTWIEGATIIHVGQQLNFSPLTTGDNGRKLSCQVDNAFRGQPIRSDQTTLLVEYDPQVNVDTTAVSVIEGRTFTRTCTATGNPTPSVRWYREGGTWLTSPQTSTSTLTVTNINRTDTAQYTCWANATSKGSNNLQPAQESFDLTVLYPPDVNVIVSGTSVNTAEVNLTCSANGLPNVYTFHGWEQHFGNQLIRTPDQLSTMTIEGGRILRLRNVTYDDMGDYKCTVNNSVPDRSGIYIRNAMALLDVKAAATFLKDDKKFQQRFDGNLTVFFDIYANPAVTYVTWKKDTQNVTGNDIVINKRSKILTFPWHSKSVMVNGTRITMEIIPFKKTRIGNYSVIIKNGAYGEIEKEFEVNVSGPPEAPENFHIVQRTQTSLTVTWTKMLNGGHEQTFFIKIKKSGDNGINYERQLSQRDNGSSDFNVTISGLLPDTQYTIWLNASNIEGNTSAINSPINNTTKALEILDSSQSAGATIGAVSGVCAAVVVIIVVIVIIVLKRRSNTASSQGSKQQLYSSPKDGPVGEETQDGIKDNVLYVSADDTLNGKPGANTAVYAEVSKPKTKKKGLVTETNQDNLYSEVKKPKKKGKKGGGSQSVKAQGDVYENVITGKTGIQESTFSGKQERGYKNQDGLLYVDVQIKPSNSQGRNVIIGEEERTDYASVDFVFPENEK